MKLIVVSIALLFSIPMFSSQSEMQPKKNKEAIMVSSESQNDIAKRLVLLALGKGDATLERTLLEALANKTKSPKYHPELTVTRTNISILIESMRVNNG